MKYCGYGIDNGAVVPDSATSINFEYPIVSDDVAIYDMMSNGEIDGLTIATDGAAVTGVGPFDIPAGGVVKLYFAIVFGDDMADFEKNVAAACKQAFTLTAPCIGFDLDPDTLATLDSATQVDNLYAGQGVVIDAYSLQFGNNTGAYTGRPGDHADVADCVPTSDPNFLKTNQAAVDPTSDAGVFTFTFEDPYTKDPLTVGQVSIMFLDVEELNQIQPLDDSRLEAYDVNDNLLGVVYIPMDTGDDIQFPAGIIADGIHYVKAYVGQPDPGGDSGALDDLCFTIQGHAAKGSTSIKLPGPSFGNHQPNHPNSDGPGAQGIFPF
jgi:hypothetical protein